MNWTTGRIARSISMPGWDDYPVRSDLAEHYGVPAVVDNDANLLGLGEQRRIYPKAHLILFVKVGTGIGASVVLDGRRDREAPVRRAEIGRQPGGVVVEPQPRGGPAPAVHDAAVGNQVAGVQQGVDLVRHGRAGQTGQGLDVVARPGAAGRNSCNRAPALLALGGTCPSDPWR